MENLEHACDRLASVSLPAELWVDGSFLTEKLDPKDVDIVARIPGHVYNSGNQDMRDARTWFTDDARRTDLSLDAYDFPDHPQDSPMYPMARERIEYWMEIFSNGRTGQYTKGIAVIQICGGVR